MEYEINDLIGLLNLAVILANGQNEDKVSIPKDAAVELVVRLEDLKTLLET